LSVKVDNQESKYWFAVLQGGQVVLVKYSQSTVLSAAIPIHGMISRIESKRREGAFMTMRLYIVLSRIVADRNTA
jgi:hypothetical protein